MHRGKGSILLSVLAFSLLLLVFAFLVAGQSLMDLGFSNRFRYDAEAEELAQAALSQFLAEARRETDRPGYWFGRFQNPVFPDGGRRLGAQVKITFDPTQPYYSVDNSLQDKPGVSYFDRGTAQTSVPPFGMSLVMQINSGGRSSVYEALLQKRWPYVLASPLSVSLECSLNPKREGASLQGNVLRMAQPANVAADRLFLPSLLYSRANASLTMWGQPPDGVFVGPDCSWNGHLRAPASSQPAPTVVLGNSPPAQLPPLAAGAWTGRISTCSEMKNLDPLLAFPSASGFKAVLPSSAAPYSTQAGVLAQMWNPNVSPRVRLNVALSPIHFEDGDYYIKGDTTNVVPVPDENDRYKSAGIHLSNARLYVDGNLELSERRNSEGEIQTLGLDGNNSTLIVNGDLILTGGKMDAGDQGLVIMCRNLFLGASGDFRGLLLVQNTAFVTQNVGTDQPLHLRGAMVCGRGKSVVCDADHPGEQFTYNALSLCSSQFSYDARYCKGILKYGEWQSMSLSKRQ